MKKKLFLGVLALAMLVLAACGPEEGRAPAAPYIGGTQGLKISFYDGFPPARVSDGGEDPFEVIVRINNRGESDVAAEDVRVSLKGFPARSFSLTEQDLTRSAPEDVERNIKNPDGSIISSVPVEVEFPGFNYVDVVQGVQEFPFLAEICYKYETRVSTSLCVKEDFRRDQDADICRVNAPRTAYNSGAPVQVTRVEQTAAGTDTTRFVFRVENRDRGTLFMHGQDCDPNSRDKNKVFVQVTDFSPQHGEILSCRGLRDGDATSGFITIGSEGYVDIACDVSFTERNARIQPFTIRLEYDYLENVQKRVLVEGY